MTTTYRARFIPRMETLEERAVPTATAAWFETAVNDESLRALAQARFIDEVLDRNDMIAIFQQVAMDGTVTAVEYGDLQDLVGNAGELNMADHVRVLSDKVVNGDAGNRWYQGQVLGNLTADGQGSQLTILVDKWFRGLDHPLTNGYYGYKAVNGSLFVNGVSFADIRQGGVADCYFLAALAETAHRTPQAIQDMFSDNGDGTYTVRFFHGGEADYVTVDRYLPVSRRGRLVFANAGDAVRNSGNELWVALAEKAYVQMSLSGELLTWRGAPTATSGYYYIGYGHIADAFHHVSGRPTAFASALVDADAVIQSYQSGQLVGFASKRTPVSSNIIGNHAYVMVGYDTATGKFNLFQPIQSARKPGATISLSWNDIVANFVDWDATTGTVAAGSGGSTAGSAWADLTSINEVYQTGQWDVLVIDISHQPTTAENDVRPAVQDGPQSLAANDSLASGSHQQAKSVSLIGDRSMLDAVFGDLETLAL